MYIITGVPGGCDSLVSSVVSSSISYTESSKAVSIEPLQEADTKDDRTQISALFARPTAAAKWTLLT